MKFLTKIVAPLFLIGMLAFLGSASRVADDPRPYLTLYESGIKSFSEQQQALIQSIEASDIHTSEALEKIRLQIGLTREKMKSVDFWLRYLDPIAYKKINGPLSVEWETEVFEKHEKPYKRLGAGLTLATQYLEDNSEIQKDSLLHLIQASLRATESYQADSTTRALQTYPHFLFCNRLYLLNLAAIYTTGFECPDAHRIIPELRVMMEAVGRIYIAYNQGFPEAPLPEAYLQSYDKALRFVQEQSDDYTQFNHFEFIKSFINPLFGLNQSLIQQHGIASGSYVDYTLNNEATSIFDKDLYYGQNSKGLFLRVNDPKVLAEIDRLGKLLFYDPILSGNNRRSCASCHKPTEYFTDTSTATALQFKGVGFLTRNTPSLINVGFNHLIMLDGKHISLQNQTKDVASNPIELNSSSDQILKKVLSCPDYKQGFTALLVQTPQEKEVTFEHLSSALTLFYTQFSEAYSPFDEAINQDQPLPAAARRGFNLFMSKAQCGTCHFPPLFNGVKPPYVSSEFEVLGVPADKDFHVLSPDKGRYGIYPAPEMLNAFRTGTLRNATYTMPYMHNGVFSNLEEVVDFYDAGGGVGKGLVLENQTLSSDSLHLSADEKRDLLDFIRSLTETVPFEPPPASLPVSRNKSLNARKVGGDY